MMRDMHPSTEVLTENLLQQCESISKTLAETTALGTQWFRHARNAQQDYEELLLRYNELSDSYWEAQEALKEMRRTHA